MMCEYCENLNDGQGAEIIYDDHWTDRFNLYKDPEGNLPNSTRRLKQTPKP